MADVMGMSHGGDGAGDQPPGGGGFNLHGSHQEDLVPRKKTRGKGKNLQLDKELKRTGRPLTVPFDTDCTYHPVGKICDYFTREVGIYMWRNIPLDREGWRNVEEHEKNALDEHLKGKFDLAQVEEDIHSSKIKGGIKQLIQKRFSDRKNKAKIEFRKAGRYADVERARTKVPDDMTDDNWQKAINHFLTPAHIKRSTSNAACRTQQKYLYRGGKSSYASRCYKEYHNLLAEYEASIQESNEGGISSQPNEAAIFKNVMGSRRGHARGIGPIPCSSKSPVVFDAESQTPEFSKAYVKGLFKNPDFRDELKNFLGSNVDPTKFANERSG